MEDGQKPDYGEIGTIFFQDGYRMARQFLSRGTGRNDILQLMVSAYESIDGLIDSFRNRCEREGMKVDCRKGCNYCCSQAVLASTHEILVIDRFLKDRLDEPALEGIRLRCAEKHTATRDMTAMQFLHYLHPCPFLSEGGCLIYPARPMACRCYLSSSVESCKKQYDRPEDRATIASLYEFPLKAGRGMNEGIRSALMEKKLVPGEWLLETLMQSVFEDENIVDSWLAGGKAFEIRSLNPEESRYLHEYYDNQEYPHGYPKREP